MSAGAMTGPQFLMRRLREIMRSSDTPEERLSKVVRLVAGAMVAEVCSVYLMLPGNVLELFETEGLNRDAVHQTRLQVGQGLVGHIAATSKPLRLRDAQAHPLFEFREETGEEIYSSLLGVPIMHSSKVVGVLVVQNARSRDYADDEQEALETVAMGFAEMIGNGALVSPNVLAESLNANAGPTRLTGRRLTDGAALGMAVLHAPRIEITRTIADDPRIELERLNAAIQDVQAQIDEMLSQPVLAAGESREVMQAFRMFAHDPGWQRRMREGVSANLTAEAAVKRAHDQTRARFQQVPDPYIRARLADMDDLANRLINRLQGGSNVFNPALPDNVILVARDLGPAEMLDFGTGKLKGVILENGSAGSHMAIVARAMNIPVIGGVNGATEAIDPGDQVIVDAEHDQVFIRPEQDVISAFDQIEAVRAEELARWRSLRDVPAVSRDGVPVDLLSNAGLLLDMQHVAEAGAVGVGLFRTELHFMVRGRLPRFIEQTNYYKSVLELAEGRPVTFRTLDVGGDKLLPYMKREKEENPAMGWRAIRISLDHPGLFRMQLRALLAACSGRELSLMFPMVADVAEFKAAREVLNKEIDWARKQGREPPSRIRLGVMVEVPALVWRLPALLPMVDFISIGSNDLMQFLYAVDRGSARVSNRYDSLSPAFLSILRRISRLCEQSGTPFSICGEMAGRPLETLALLGLGFTQLSMRSNAIGQIKELILSTDIRQLRHEMESWLGRDERTLRPLLQEFASRNHIET
ncbi:phosphoenolpyruvate--protein phosphotransferase [Minwuia sp.]|uniref:phosphoenolpyruvate--protein phosphotransferase n=1 Tax=Minwuia sp. TaxID=2493630 RepID=UPI003A8F58A9